MFSLEEKITVPRDVFSLGDIVTGIGNCIERARPMCVTDKTRMRKQLVYYY